MPRFLLPTPVPLVIVVLVLLLFGFGGGQFTDLGSGEAGGQAVFQGSLAVL